MRFCIYVYITFFKELANFGCFMIKNCITNKPISFNFTKLRFIKENVKHVIANRRYFVCSDPVTSSRVNVNSVFIFY